MADTIHTQPELSDDELLRVYGLAKRDHNYEGPIDDWPKRAERAATVAGLRAAIAADRARAALAQPEPEGPTDEELLKLMPQQFRDDLATVSRMAAHGAGPGVGAGLFRVSLNTGALNFARAAIAADRARRQPGPPEPGEVAVEKLRAAVDAALAEADSEEPRLQWTENLPPSEDCRYDHCIAETPFGRFLVTWKSWKKFDSPTVDETPWGDWYAPFGSVDEAKSACQQELNQRLAHWGRPACKPLGLMPQPVPVSERLPEPGVKVLAHYLNDLGEGRTVCAIWVPAKSRTEEGDLDSDDFLEYDEEDDKFYWPEGWYEAIENWEELGWVRIYEGEIVYWQPLPQWPAHALPLPGEVEG